MYNPYGFNAYNPTQSRIEQLTQQRQMIEQQLAQLNAPSPVNINVNPNQNQNPNFFGSNGSSFDFNGRYVSSIEEAKKEAAQNLPLLFIDKENPYLYMKDTTGNIKTFKLEEVQEKPDETHQKINALEGSIAMLQEQMNQLIGALTGQPVAKSATTEPQPAQPQQNQKSQPRKKTGES